MEGSSEHSNEILGSIKYLGNSWVDAQLVASQEGLMSMELVSSCMNGEHEQNNK
jgi:hypothetical protein